MEMLDKALVRVFKDDGVFRRGFDNLVEEITSSHSRLLRTSKDMNEIIHARGFLDGIDSLKNNIARLMEEYDE